MAQIFILVAAVMLMAALCLALWVPHRRHHAGVLRLTRAAAGLQAFRDQSADSGSTSAGDTGALAAAIDATLRAAIEVDRTHKPPVYFSAIAFAVFVPLAATAAYRGATSLQAPPPVTSNAAMNPATKAPMGHGSDMHAAIAKLSAKLETHPDDPEGWALLGRTYKAMNQVPLARAAFARAVAAAPQDMALAREYANADVPSPAAEPQNANLPKACAVPWAEFESDCESGASSAKGVGVVASKRDLRTADHRTPSAK